MKCKVLTLLLSLVCLTALSQKEYKVYDWKTEYSFNAHLSQLMHRQYEQRQHNFQRALKSTDSLQEYIHSVRTRFKEILGQLPPQTPLNAKVVRSTISTRFSDHKILIQYRRERILFESFPGHHVTATLYIPTGKEQDPIGRSPYPGLLFLCGHEDAGKATPSYQQLAGELVESGFVVLVVDPLSQSERHQLTGSNGKPLTRGGTTEHTLINAASNLVGTSAAAYELWDNKRALDYLLTRPEVDTSRIGVLGNSGGAIQAMYLLAFEPRIKATAVNSYLSSRARTFDLTGPADGCAHIPGEGRALLEMSDYLIAAAPRPVLVTAGRFDFIDFEGTKLAVRELEQVYGLLGKPSHVKFSMYEDGHGYSLQKNQATVFFFQEALYDSVLGTKSHIHEILSDTALFVTGAGQVNAAFSNEVTVFERNLQLANELKSSRKQFLSQSRDSIINKIAELLALDRGWKAGPNGGGRSFKRKGIEYRTYELQLNGEVPVPIILADTFLHRQPVKPTDPQPAKVVLWLHDGGKHIIADSADLITKYKREGTAVFMADLRGFGELQDPASLNDPKYFNREYRNAMFAIHLGSSAPAQRTADVYNVLEEGLKDYPSDIPVEIHAVGPACIPALHAALLSYKKISGIKLYNCIGSFKDILKDPARKDWYSWVIPGVLKYYDIPDLVALVGNKKVQFIQ